MAENVRVVVRCRPMNTRENELKCRNIVNIEDCTLSVQNPSDINAPPKTFTYDIVYDELAPTEAIYNDICYSLVDNVLEGYNGTIFAYGQTGCGKTHTMQGPEVDSSSIMAVPSSHRGIISRTFDHIFEAISVSSGVRFLALISYLEIYNETIHDLLNPNDNTNHALKELPGIGVTVPTLSTHTVHNAQECYHLLNMGNSNRMMGATLMNANSSRSHSIFTVSLEQIHDDDAVIEGAEAVRGIRRGKLNLVDLAGSERHSKTGAVGDRFREATKINLSLSALGNVISALVDGKTKHIPYRDSKLTRLLQDSLGGNTKTIMISCISPADNNYDETISTLRYASRAKNISNKPKINEDPKDAKLREYQEEILKLKRMLDENHNQPAIFKDSVELPYSSSVNDEAMEHLNRKWLEDERVKLKLEMDEEMQRLKQEHDMEQKEKDKRMHEMEELRTHYETQLKRLSTANGPANDEEPQQHQQSAQNLQLEARKRIELIKLALIGGERANDTQLKERRQKKKLDAQRRLSALAHVLSRVEQTEDRDLLQGHYSNIQHELNAKNEYIKAYRQKVKALEREVSDLQAEFQLDRADYLESIRRLERNLKFYQQLMDKALPILRKAGKYWDPDDIIQNSSWNDDLKTWKLPDGTMNSLKLPPATTNGPSAITSKNYVPQKFDILRPTTLNTTSTIPSSQGPDTKNASNDGRDESDQPVDQDANSNVFKSQSAFEKDPHNYKIDILNNYFRSNRQKTTEHHAQPGRKNFNHWKELTQRIRRKQHLQPEQYEQTPTHDHNLESPAEISIQNRVLSSWLPPHRARVRGNSDVALNRTWGGSDRLLFTALHNNFKMHNGDGEDSAPYPSSSSDSGSQQLSKPHSPITEPYDADELTLAAIRYHPNISSRRRPHKLAALDPTREA